MTSSFVTIDAPPPKRTPGRLMNLSPLVLRHGSERPSPRESALEGVVEANGRLAPLPAEEHEPPVDAPIEIDEPLHVVLQDHAERADPLDVLLEGHLHVVPLPEQLTVLLPPLDVRVRDPVPPVFLRVHDELEDLPQPEGAVVHLPEDRLEGRQDAVRLLEREHLRRELHDRYAPGV